MAIINKPKNSATKLEQDLSLLKEIGEQILKFNLG